MSADSFEAAPSTASETVPPSAASFSAGAMPEPSRQFDCGQCAMPVPVSASRRISSSSICTRCASQTSVRGSRGRRAMHRPLAVGRQAEVDVGRGFREMAVEAQAHTARFRGDHSWLLRFERPRRRGRCEGDAAHAGGRRIVIALRAGLDRFDHMVERLGGRRNEVGRIEHARLGGAAAAEHEADTELFGHLEDHVARDRSDSCRHRDNGGRPPSWFRTAAARRGRCAPPYATPPRRSCANRNTAPHAARRAAGVDAGAHALEHALEQMMMGRDEARIDHAAGRVDHLLAGLAFERANRRDAPVGDADRAGGADRIARKPGENSLRALDQRRGHVSAATSLSCHWPSASLDKPIITANRPTPASVMRKSAANMRGMSSWKPDCRIS